MSTSFRLDASAAGQKRRDYLRIPVGEPPAELAEWIHIRETAGQSPASIIAQEISHYWTDGTLKLPVLVVKGSRQGPTLLATAGVHGDEFEGMEAIYRVYDGLNPHSMAGTFLALPIVSPPAFWSGSRLSPVDGKNMARVFPGSPGGTVSERIAHALVNDIFPGVDLYVDLHSAGRNLLSVTLCGYAEQGEQALVARKAAQAFGAPVIWRHPAVAPGRTLSAAIDMGIPSLYTEARGAGGAGEDDIQFYTQGLMNLLEFLRVIPESGSKSRPSGSVYIGGCGDIDRGIVSPSSGYFCASLEPGARVSANQPIGRIRSLDGTVTATVLAKSSGILVFYRHFRRVFEGELIAFVAEEVDPGPDIH